MKLLTLLWGCRYINAILLYIYFVCLGTQYQSIDLRNPECLDLSSYNQTLLNLLKSICTNTTSFSVKGKMNE